MFLGPLDQCGAEKVTSSLCPPMPRIDSERSSLAKSNHAERCRLHHCYNITITIILYTLCGRTMLKNYLYLHMGEIVKACGRNVMTTAYHIGYIKMIHLILMYLFVLTSPSNRLFFFLVLCDAYFQGGFELITQHAAGLAVLKNNCTRNQEKTNIYFGSLFKGTPCVVHCKEICFALLICFCTLYFVFYILRNKCWIGNCFDFIVK